MKEDDIGEYPKSKYEKYIKDRCAICLRTIYGGWERYVLRGNYCEKCNARCEKKTHEKNKTREKYILIVKVLKGTL